MPKPLVYRGKLLGNALDPGLPGMILVGILGLGLLTAEGAMLSAQGVPGVAYVLTAVFVASTVSSIAGFAFSALCGALLFHLMDSPVYAVHVMIVCSIAIQLLSVAALWRDDRLAQPAVSSWLAAFSACPSASICCCIFRPAPIGMSIGGLLIVYGGYLLLRWPVRAFRIGTAVGRCAGFLGGLTGGLAGFPGAFVTIWCGLKGWDKARQRGVYQPFILCMQPVTLIAIYLMRPSSPTRAQLDWKTLAFVPAALLGAWFGLRIFKRLSDRQFELVVNALLILSGVGLIL